MSETTKDDYKIKNADICVRCRKFMCTKRGGLRYDVCDDCADTLKKEMEHYNKYGLYALAERSNHE